MHNNYDGNAATLAAKVDALIEQTTKRANNICKRHNIPQDTAAVFAEDVADMLRAQFNGLRATNEQMRQLTEAIPQTSWDRTENAALCFIAQYYKNIVEALGGNIIMGAGFLHAVEYYEIIKRNDGKPLSSIFPQFSGLEDDTQTAWEEAQRLYFTYAILVIAELTDATAEELAAMRANGVGVFDEDTKARTIAAGIDFQQQRRQINQRAAERKAARMDKQTQTAPTLPNMLESNRTIRQYQTITSMLGAGLQTADVDADGRTNALRPLRTGIREMQERAALIARDIYATEQQRKQAEELIATTTAVYQVMDGIQLLPQMLSPDSGSTEYSGYYLTPYRWAQICTQQQQPNTDVIRNVLCATDFLSHQRTRITEKGTRLVKQLDANGNVIYDEHGKALKKNEENEFYTYFQPLVLNVRGNSGESVPFEKAELIYIEIHNIIRYGRSNKSAIIEKNGNKKRLFIQPPAEHILTLGQIADFQSDEERIFRNIIVSTFSNPQTGTPAHLREDKLLARVFDYEARQAEYDAAALAASQHEAKVNATPSATDEDRTAAAKATKKATEKAKYYITNHMGNDVNTLRVMFEKALKNGLIKRYGRIEAARRKDTKKYGANYVWNWERPDEVTSTRKRK